MILAEVCLEVTVRSTRAGPAIAVTVRGEMRYGGSWAEVSDPRHF